MDPIKFGTDGWRARIAEGYTFTNLRRCAQGFASYLHQEGLAERVDVDLFRGQGGRK